MHSSNLTGRTAKIGPDHPNAPRFTPTHADRIPRDPAARDPQWPDRWPLRTHLELAPLDTAPGSARAHVTAVLREWKASGDAVDDGAAVVTELTTNAVETTWKHGLYVPVRLWMLGDRASAVFLVWDATDPAPVLRDATSDAEHGRGLQMVNGLSQRWGYYRPDEHPFGKVVWAIVHTTPVAPDSTANGFVS